jgi:hypothetical protein
MNIKFMLMVLLSGYHRFPPKWCLLRIKNANAKNLLISYCRLLHSHYIYDRRRNINLIFILVCEEIWIITPLNASIQKLWNIEDSFVSLNVRKDSILFRSFGFIALKTLNYLVFQSRFWEYLIEGYSRNVSCALFDMYVLRIH